MTMRKLKHLADVRVSTVDKTTVDGEVAVRLCNYVDVYNHDRITPNLPFMEATATPPQVREFGLRGGDVLFTKDSETAEDIAVPALVPETLPGVVCGYHLAVARPRAADVDGRYLFWALAATPSREQFTVAATGVTRFGLRADDMGNVTVPLWSLAKQRSIADYLDAETARIDALITKKHRVLALVHERLAATVERIALPHLDHPTRQFPSDVPREHEYPDDWLSLPLGLLLSRVTYGFTNPMPTTDDGPFLLTANDIDDGAIQYGSARHTSSEAFRTLLTDKSRPRRDDILLTKDGSLGRVALFDGASTCINQSVALLRPRPEVIVPELLAELLRVRAYTEALVFNAGGTTIKHLYITRIIKQRIAFPPDHERQMALLHAIKEDRHSSDQLSARLVTQIGLLLEHRRALITAAVTDNVDILGTAT
jgi:type I restriction enzyme S subunit